MTHLNQDLAIRRQLAEKIQSLEYQLNIEKTRIKVLESTVTEYSKRSNEQTQRYLDLIDDVSKAALEIPKDHRRRIMNVLPVS